MFARDVDIARQMSERQEFPAKLHKQADDDEQDSYTAQESSDLLFLRPSHHSCRKKCPSQKIPRRAFASIDLSLARSHIAHRSGRPSREEPSLPLAVRCDDVKLIGCNIKL